MTIEIIYFLLIILVASLSRSTFGFGDALIAMPLLAFVFSIKLITPIVAVSGLTISILILIRDRKNIRIGHIRKILIYSVLGIPFGIFFLSKAPEDIVKSVLALILIIFGLLKLFNKLSIFLENDRYAVFFGLLSGALGGAYNTNGPPIIIYGNLRRWKSSEFRLNLQSIFLPTNLFIVVGHIVSGLWNDQNMKMLLLAFPILIISVITGNYLHRKIENIIFEKIVYIFLLIIGSVLFVNMIF